MAPVLGTGLNIGHSHDVFGVPINPAVTSNFALQNGEVNPQFGGGANVGSLDLSNFRSLGNFDLNNLGNLFGR